MELLQLQTYIIFKKWQHPIWPCIVLILYQLIIKQKQAGHVNTRLDYQLSKATSCPCLLHVTLVCIIRFIEMLLEICAPFKYNLSSDRSSILHVVVPKMFYWLMLDCAGVPNKVLLSECMYICCLLAAHTVDSGWQKCSAI